MTRIELPVRIRFLRVPVRWEFREVPSGPQGELRIWAFPTVLYDSTPDHFKLKEVDAWTCRESFLAVPENDNEAMRLYLESVGIWLDDSYESEHPLREIAQHRAAGHPHAVTLFGLWRFRTMIKRALINPRGFREKYGVQPGRPETALQLLNETRRVMEFPLSMELGKAVSGIIALNDAYRMLLATVYIDVVRGIRFKVCARKDCQRPFPLESKHAKKFCCWYCAHITTVRKNRPSKKRRSKRT